MASPYFLIPVLFLLQVLLAFGKVNLNSVLSTSNISDAWRSPSGDFAFGFRQLSGTNLFMVAIWYDRIPEKTIVWNAYIDNNPTVPLGSQLQLRQEGLYVVTPNSESLISMAGPSFSYGEMNDTGDFVLRNSDSIMWKSSSNPTDTLLPGQSFDANQKLTSRLTETNYTRGRFQLHFEAGNVLLSFLGWPSDSPNYSYYIIDTSSSASRLVFNGSGVYVERSHGSSIQKWGNLNPKENYYRATLDFYGTFTLYSHPRDSNTKQGWQIMKYVPDNICAAGITSDHYGRGACGYNSYCIFGSGQKPSCRCPSGYSLVDPSNPFGGCQPNFTLVCGADIEARPEEIYNFTIEREINFPFGDYEKIDGYNQEECQQSCLHDCMCAVAILSGQTCWKKRLPLINGIQVQRSEAHFVFIKKRVSPLGNLDPGATKEIPIGPDSKKKDSSKPILLGSLIGPLVLLSILLITIALVLRAKPRKLYIRVASLLETNLHSFTYEDLKEATRGFSEEVGKGSFGIVYKGKLESGPYNAVAIKKSDRLAQEREKEFMTELSAIGKTSHKNLVRLIGFCEEGTHRMLVYEFMSNGTLADVLFARPKPNWNMRVGFALGIARGLVYLHEECDAPIIHCDIKPQNILIDENFTTKISDFGLAKLLSSDQSRTKTMIRGTRGYVAPEWFKNVPVTAKVDVYSFGVVLLEIICCRRSVLMESGEEEKTILTDWTYDCYVKGKLDDLVEEDKEAMVDNARLQKWVKIAMWCIQEHHEMRPTMRMVMHMLEGLVEVPNPPLPSSFFSYTS